MPLVKRWNNTDIVYGVFNAPDYFCSSKDVVDVWYFSHVRNVGDLVGPYLLNKLTGKKPRKNLFGIRPHYLTVGSILEQTTTMSYIWGSGFLSRNHSLRCQPKAVDLVRGKFTLEKLKLNLNIALGDPALILPRFYNPSITQKYKVGVVLHYEDQQCLTGCYGNQLIKLIDVRQSVETFIDEILSCEYIVSSSLHGLIFADAYGIPNKGIRFYKASIRDDFKYHDYYSALKKIRCFEPIVVDDLDDQALSNLIKKCTVSELGNIQSRIESSFNDYS